jgi:hypothetical protein
MEYEEQSTKKQDKLTAENLEKHETASKASEQKKPQSKASQKQKKTAKPMWAMT